MKKRITLLLATIFFLSSQLLVAQKDSSAIKFYRPSEIPVKIEEASSFLVKEKNKFVNTSMLFDAEKMLAEFKTKFTDLNLISDSTKLTHYNSVQLRNLYRRWVVLQQQMSKSLQSISDRTTFLGVERRKLEMMQQVWEETRKLDTTKVIPPKLSNSIISLEKEIISIATVLQKESTELLNVQSGFSDKNIIIETKLIYLNNLISSKQRATFEQNTYPLWQYFADTTKSIPISAQANNLLTTYKVSIKNYYDSYESKILLAVLIFILLLGFTFLLKYYSNKIEDDSPTVQKALLLLENPFAISVLLFLLLLSFTTEATTTFKGFRKVLMLIPLLFVLLKIINPKLKSGLKFFMFLFLVMELKVNTGSDTPIERFLLLGLTLLTYIAIYWTKHKELFSSIKTNKQIESLFQFVFRFSITLVSLVLILNILGYVMLSNVLINGFYNSIYATILLLTANLVLNAIILLLLKTKPMQKFKIVLYHSANITRTAQKILKLILSVAWIVVVFDAFHIYEMVYSAIVELLGTDLGFGSISISLGEIFSFFIIIWLSLQLSRFIQFILEVDILPQLKLPRGVPGAIMSLSKYIVVSLGFFFAVVSLGVDFNKFAILIGALGVGIGFGLQNLVNNFISGIVLIFERPIQVGDVIKVGEITGTVKKIGIRASVVRTFEGAEIIVPNGNLISGELTNWTFSDHFRRIDIAVGVEYGSDVNKVKELLLEASKSIKSVLERPEPIVLFHDFGNSSLDFILRCWTKDFDNWLFIESELRFIINTLFEENNITIPFPQTDINFKNNLQIDEKD